MDDKTVKETLSVYRPGTTDEHDPFFAEALAAVRRNPELAGWFADSQRFDTQMTAKLEQAPVPPAVIHGFQRLAIKHTVRFHFAPWIAAAAAAIVAAFVLGRVTAPQPYAPGGSDSGSLALRAMTYSGKMPALQFVCFDAEEVKGWVDKKSATLHMGQLIDKPVPNLHMIGSSTTEWSGKPVVMIALQDHGKMGMLYLVRAADFPAAAASEVGQVTELNGWASKTGRRGDHVYVLTTRGTRDDLAFPMPL